MNRLASLQAAGSATDWDVIVIGGGATGLGTALDSVSRGYRTLLLEQADFAKGTSSRSTKLSHGGVRYLQQGNIRLVLEALQERGRMLRNAPHLVHRQPFVIPAPRAWEVPFYGIGLKLYDALARGSSFGASRILSASTVRDLIPTLSASSLAGGVLYFDGQFDDARYALALARTFTDMGGVALNYAPMVRFLQRDAAIRGVVARDLESGQEFELSARVVISATGVFTDQVRLLDSASSDPVLSVSQGSHLVLPRAFLPSTHALMVPRTSDGRVLFAIPWHGAVVIGTTDDPVPGPSLEPRPMQQELDFLRRHILLYFGREPLPSEVLSQWSGLRPLVRKQGARSTAALSREHSVLVSPSGLVSITGGKWTTYRRMGEDAIDIASRLAGLPRRPSQTQELRLHGWTDEPSSPSALSIYGSDQPALAAIAAESPSLAQTLHPRLPYLAAEVLWAARHEMARTVDDVLARRTRALFLDSRAAIEAAPLVAQLLASELHRDPEWQRTQVDSFTRLAQAYVFQP